MISVVLDSIITCPACGHREAETMSTNACVWFYECEHCKATLRPKPGNCCVYCSYDTNRCPPMQQSDSCCVD
nr:GDCCVxC domain-containing (seleno)protein [Paraburkholderia aromaticivorans]